MVDSQDDGDDFIDVDDGSFPVPTRFTLNPKPDITAWELARLLMIFRVYDYYLNQDAIEMLARAGLLRHLEEDPHA
jgi:hypothetical protein